MNSGNGISLYLYEACAPGGQKMRTRNWGQEFDTGISYGLIVVSQTYRPALIWDFTTIQRLLFCLRIGWEQHVSEFVGYTAGAIGNTSPSPLGLCCPQTNGNPPHPPPFWRSNHGCLVGEDERAQRVDERGVDAPK